MHRLQSQARCQCPNGSQYFLGFELTSFFIDFFVKSRSRSPEVLVHKLQTNNASPRKGFGGGRRSASGSSGKPDPPRKQMSVSVDYSATFNTSTVSTRGELLTQRSQESQHTANGFGDNNIPSCSPPRVRPQQQPLRHQPQILQAPRECQDSECKCTCHETCFMLRTGNGAGNEVTVISDYVTDIQMEI